MTLQWTVVAVFLYGEIAFLFLLMLPWIRSHMWAKLFKSRFVRGIQTYSHVYSWAGAGILLLLFFDAIREVRKYSSVEATMGIEAHPNADAVVHMRLFRAQRNLYIAGFALFLWFVIRRMVGLLSREAQLQASADAALTQARNASDAASRAMNEGGESAALKQMQVKVDEANQELQKAMKDRDAMKIQSENLQQEYDRVCERLKEYEMNDGDKKTN